MAVRAEWKSKVAFAEVAEALGVPTEQMMAVRWNDGDCVALWTSDEAEPVRDTAVFATTLRRDSGGILRVALLPRRVGKLGDFLPPGL